MHMSDKNGGERIRRKHSDILAHAKRTETDVRWLDRRNIDRPEDKKRPRSVPRTRRTGVDDLDGVHDGRVEPRAEEQERRLR